MAEFKNLSVLGPNGKPICSDDEILKKFWSKVDRSGGPDACWLWQLQPNNKGYGRFSVQYNKNLFAIRELAHRMAYMAHHNIRLTDPKIRVCHNCPGGDNPLCCNPAHLWLGTDMDNWKDCVEKGRFVWRKPPIVSMKGESNPSSKFTNLQVRKIRGLYDSGDYTIYSLSKKYKAGYGCIKRIVERTSYKDI
jgi:hypothetical protein